MHSSLLLATCLVALASAAPDSLQWLSLLDPREDEDTIQFNSSTELEDAWEAFKINYEKTYEDENKEMARKEIFAENLKAVNENNYLYSKGLKTFTMEINQFADLDDSEFMNLMTGYVPPEDLSMNSSLPPENASFAPPKRLDWRNRGYVTRVKNQRSCGSCWAFSATGALEGQHFRKTGRLVSLSEQQLIDCSKKNHGCKGGWTTKAFAYVVQNGGIDTEYSYPYEAKDYYCRYRRATRGATCKSYKQYWYLSEYQLQRQVARIGPLSVAIDASQKSFRFYKRGIYYEPRCKKAVWKLNHAVLVVGYGRWLRNQYWIVKNSWGTNWGMNGYIRMSKNRRNNCGIASYVSYPVV